MKIWYSRITVQKQNIDSNLDGIQTWKQEELKSPICGCWIVDKHTLAKWYEVSGTYLVYLNYFYRDWGHSAIYSGHYSLVILCSRVGPYSQPCSCTVSANNLAHTAEFTLSLSCKLAQYLLCCIGDLPYFSNIEIYCYIVLSIVVTPSINQKK